jgi:hypothetical protein
MISFFGSLKLIENYSSPLYYRKEKKRKEKKRRRSATYHPFIFYFLFLKRKQRPLRDGGSVRASQCEWKIMPFDSDAAKEITTKLPLKTLVTF